MKERALQRLVQSALEPEWEARFEPNSYGFRPGRSCHDAIEAIFNAIRCKPKYVLDADIEKCFDRIAHQELLRKVNAGPTYTPTIKGVVEGRRHRPESNGSRPKAVRSKGARFHRSWRISPCTELKRPWRKKYTRNSRRGFYLPIIVRYADDLVAVHDDLNIIREVQELIETQLKPMGLRLKPEKTRITHTLKSENGPPGFDFLGFNIRQYPVGKTHSGKDPSGKAARIQDDHQTSEIVHPPANEETAKRK